MKEESLKKLKKSDIKLEEGFYFILIKENDLIQKRKAEKNIDSIVQKSKISKALAVDSSEIQGVHKWWE